MSSSSTIISLSSKPSLFGTPVSTVSSKKLEGNPPNGNGRRAAGKKKKSKPKPSGSYARFSLGSMREDDSTDSKKVSSSDLELRRKTFKFSGGDTEAESEDTPTITTITQAYELHDELTDLDFSKVNHGLSKDDGAEGDETDSEAEGDETDSEDEASDHLQYVMDRRLFELPCVQGLIDRFKASVRKNVVKQLGQMLEIEATSELVLEMADSIDLLRLLGASNPSLDGIAEKARKGAILYKNGTKKISEGQELLSSVLDDIRSLPP